MPTATGMPNNGFEGMRFLGYPIFEGLVLWDLSRADKLAGLRPGLAEKWEQDPADKKTWIFKLRRGVKFHDGTDFNADAVIWNLDRYFKQRQPAIRAAGVRHLARPRAADGQLQARSTTTRSRSPPSTPASYFPYMAVYLLITSPASFEKAGRDWAKVAALPAAGTGPFRITKVTPRESAELATQRGLLGRRPQGRSSTASACCRCRRRTSRLAALRSGQVDWIEVPPPDAIPSAEAGRLRGHDEFLPACLAVAVQHERRPAAR